LFALTDTGHALRIRDIARFHLPLAVTFVSYGIVFNIINAAMSAASDAAIALAAFAVGQSLVDLFAGPAGAGNQWLLARGRDRRSFGVGARVMLQIGLIVTAMLALAGFTPFGQWLYQTVFGAPARLSPQISLVIKLALPMPLLWAWRNASQSVIMLRRQTQYLSAGVFLRLASVWALSAMITRLGAAQGAGLGAVLWLGGMLVEAGFLFAVARRSFRSLPEQPADRNLPTPGQVWRFLLPLIATGLGWAIARPLANAAMARTPQPETAIAAFQVGWFVSFLLVALQVEFRQVMVVFWSDRASLKTLSRYAIGLSLALTLFTLGFGVTGGAVWFMRGVLGTPEEIIPAARAVFLASALGPLAWIVAELQVGRLLRTGRTQLIGIAKSVNLVTMAAVLALLVLVGPDLGALIGVFGYVSGAFAESIFLVRATRKLPDTPVSHA
jgi:hypothetical protein